MAEPLSIDYPQPFAEESYWQQSRGPLASLLFLSPLLILYEGGVLVFGSGGVRNGADACLRSLLDMLGFSGYFLLPFLTVFMLLAWHHTTRKPWRVRGRVLSIMLIESALLGFILVGIAHLQGMLFAPFLSPRASDAEAVATLAMTTSFGQTAARLIGFFGAGLYEEELFRLLLLPIVAALLGAAGLSPRRRAWGAIGITSLIFSIAHYIGPYGDVLQVYTFTFRFLAGALFALLFVYRGFGIAAGTHALYDIFVGLQ